MNTALMALLLLAPLLGFLINGLNALKPFGFHLGIRGAVASGAVATAAIFVSFCSTLLLGWPILGAYGEALSFRLPLFDWLRVGGTEGLSLQAAFVMDALSLVMCLVITGVGTLIHLFSIGYMSHDPQPSKYFAYLNLFVFCMLILVFGEQFAAPLYWLGGGWGCALTS